MLLLRSEHHAESEREELPASHSLGLQSPKELSLADRIEQAFKASGYLVLRTLAIAVHGQNVVLQGRVPSYYMKQLAQAIALKIPGVQELCNEVKVISPPHVSR
jgi:osmotically-inducible protein OsmY